MIDQLLKEIVTQLKNSGIDSPVREVRLMLAAILNTTHEQILFNPPHILTSEQMNQLEDWVCRRCKREPLAKIIGKKEFWGRDFFVTKDTLDPRPDTETLIDVILNLASNKKPLRILDLGTGSGCLILTLLAERPNWTGIGVDFSQSALGVAQQNAENLNLSKRVRFFQSDWFQNVEGVFDVIISNPPYIARDEVLSDETLHDPENALFADDGGLADYRRILESASRFLTPSGFIVFEIGYRQATAVIEIAQFFEFDLVSLHQDLAGHDRCLVFKK
jgi:release factor glutamine methyltransferase